MLWVLCSDRERKDCTVDDEYWFHFFFQPDRTHAHARSLAYLMKQAYQLVLLFLFIHLSLRTWICFLIYLHIHIFLLWIFFPEDVIQTVPSEIRKFSWPCTWCGLWNICLYRNSYVRFLLLTLLISVFVLSDCVFVVYNLCCFEFTKETHKRTIQMCLIHGVRVSVCSSRWKLVVSMLLLFSLLLKNVGPHVYILRFASTVHTFAGMIKREKEWRKERKKKDIG